MMHKFKKSRAVFLDRDGVINRETGEYVYTPEAFEFNEGLFQALKILRDRGFILVVITNQGGIGQKLYTHKHVETINELLRTKLLAQGIEITEVYYCPHHPVSGNCLCRKPGSLMIEKAIARFNIDPSLSFMIGDNERDIKAAEKAGVKGVLIKANDSLMNYENIFKF
jgi:D-glycero-D-manno-heptose 1,7-bisphosphate phosphatase